MTDARGFDGASVIDGYFDTAPGAMRLPEEITHGSIS